MTIKKEDDHGHQHSHIHYGTAKEQYFVPEQTRWPIVASIGLFTIVIGVLNILNQHPTGWALFFFGALLIAVVMFGWFGNVIRESIHGMYNAQADRSFRWGMVWFIFSEVMFFGAFFGALFYARLLSVPWLGGEGDKGVSHMLWQNFQAAWPLLVNPDPARFPSTLHAMNPWDLPALNTLILLTSGATVTYAHYALKKNKRIGLVIGLLATVMLGLLFLCIQAFEFHEAYADMNLKLTSGIYGTTFFMLTGFHGAHVTIGAIMLTVILIRCLRGHFTPHNHFAFEATAWYWHFVDVVWLFLFTFVYWL